MNNTYQLVRQSAALFDFSADGRFFLQGAGAEEAVNAIIAADLETTRELKALNTLLLAEDGSITAILWVLKSEDGIWVLCDAKQRSIVGSALNAAALNHNVECQDRTESTTCLVIIGPAAQEIAMTAAGEDIIGIPYLGLEPNTQTNSLLCRLGYTGEFEYRFITERARASELENQLLTAGSSQGLERGDLSVLPLLMLEMRSLDQNTHIPSGISPIEAGLHWMVSFKKDAFPGREAIMTRKISPVEKALILILDGDVAPTTDVPVLIENNAVGRCVYLAQSPTLGKTIALAYVQADLAWVGVIFEVTGQDARAVSAPLFITKTVTAGR
ncbi:hypothetical protein TI04_02820 [Achromatium sp. WMS2]|nr:hypothetical protein TI04_02820 [Achromatium sp. WMS2]